MAGRSWSYWTRGKLDILRRYLDAFTTTTKFKSPTERIYLDAFAGQVENRDRRTGEVIDGSARIALATDDPPFSRLHFFELPQHAALLETTLRHEYPDREFVVHPGDCNDTIPAALDSLKDVAWAPTFAFIDPDGMQAAWSTIAEIARFRTGKWKAELWLLFAQPQFARLLRVDGEDVRPEDVAVIDRMFGTHDWWLIYDARRAEDLEPAQARAEYLNLLRWRLESDLGYRWTHPLEVHNEHGSVIYFMIFATDNETGTKIMSDLYARAAAEFPAMREEARRIKQRQDDEAHGLQRLFGPEADPEAPPRVGERFYEHEPPWKPWFLADT